MRRLQILAVNTGIAFGQAAGVALKVTLQHPDGVLVGVQIVFMVAGLAGVAQLLAELVIFPAENVEPRRVAA